MWLTAWTFVKTFWPWFAGAAIVLILVIASQVWISRHDRTIRETERTACNAEYAIKESEREAAIQKANDAAQKSKARNTQKSRTLAPAAVINELSSNSWLRPD